MIAHKLSIVSENVFHSFTLINLKVLIVTASLVTDTWSLKHCLVLIPSVSQFLWSNSLITWVNGLCVFCTLTALHNTEKC